MTQGMLAWEQDDFQGALDIFQELLDEHPRFPDLHNKAGLCHAMLGDVQAALDAFDRAIDIAPTYAEAHVNRGIVLNELRRHQEAMEAFARSAQLDVQDGTEFPSHLGNQLAATHAELGDLYLAGDRPDLAVEEYRAALEIRPRFLDIRSKLGEALLETGSVEEARDELRHVVERNPAYLHARLRLGVALHRLGDDEGAITEWEEAGKVAPDDMRPEAYIASVRGEDAG